MDEDLKKMLDEAHASGASEAQLQGIIDLYKKKSQDGTPSGDTSGSVLATPETAPALFQSSGSNSANGTSSLDGAKALDPYNIDFGKGGDEADSEPKKGTPGWSMASISGAFNTGLSSIVDAISGISKLQLTVNPEHTYNNYMKNMGLPGMENPASKLKGMDANNMTFDGFFNDVMKTALEITSPFHVPGTAPSNILEQTVPALDKGSAELKKSGTDNPLPDTFLGNSTKAVIELTPTVLAMMATDGASASAPMLENAGGYLTKTQIVQNALTKLAGPLTQYLATTKALEGISKAYDDSHGDAGSVIEGGITGFNEGVKQGVSLELQMAVGGELGGELFKKAVSAGIADESGKLTEQALKSFIGSPVAFASGAIAGDLANGRPIDWKNAGVSAVTALPFEVPHLFEAYNVSKANKANEPTAADHATLEKAINEAVTVRDNNSIVNFMLASPGETLQAMRMPESSQDLQVQAIEKGIAAQKATDYKDKNTLHLQQLELQKQADIKRLGEVVINQGVDGFIQAVNHTELPDETKSVLLNKANAINQVFNPVELQKTEIGKSITDLNGQIQNIHNVSIGADPGVVSDNLVKLNDLVGQRVKAQSDLFDLSYGDAQQQKTAVALADHIAENPITNPVENTPAKTIIPINTDFIKDAHLTEVKDNGDVQILQKDGTTETLTDKERKTLGITNSHIKQFKEANKEAAGQPAEPTPEKITVAPPVLVKVEREEGESEQAYKLRSTTDPNELANMYHDKVTDLKNSFDIDGAIADYNGRISPANFYEHDDRNNVTPAIARNYFTRKGDRAMGIDIQAQEINDIYFNGTDTVQPGDITDFMVRYPGGHTTYFTPSGNNELAAINDRYKEITGKNLRKDIARKLAERYNVANSVAEAQAEIINGEHNSAVLENRIKDLVTDSGPFEGLPDMDKIQAEFDRYVSDPSNEWNMWHDVFDGKVPDENDIELTKSIIDERRAKEGPGEGTNQEPAITGEDSTPVASSPGDSEPGVTASTTEPKRVEEEYDRQIAELDDKISKAESALKKAEENINNANDLFASSGSTDDGTKDDKLFKQNADVSKENTDRILKPLYDQVEKLKSDREDLLSEKEKAVEQAGRQTQFGDAASASQELADSKIDPEAQKAVRSAMVNLFPKIGTHYYENVEDFKNAASKTDLKKAIDNGHTIYAFVDQNREIHFNPEHMSKDTQLHEQGHILTNWAYHYAPALYERMIGAGRVMGDLHHELRQNGYTIKGDRLYDEAFVTALGREGAGELDKIVKGHAQRGSLARLIHEAWTKFERWVAGRTGFSIDKFKNIRNMTFGEFSKYVNEKYLFSDVKISDISSKELADKNGISTEEAQLGPDRPERAAGESLSDFAKRIADWQDEKDRLANEDKQTDPEHITGSTNGTQLPLDTSWFPDEGPEWSLPDETNVNKAQRKGQDYMNRFKVAQEAIKNAGREIDKDSDYYNHQRRIAAIAEHQIGLVHEDIFKSPNKNKPALFEQMKREKISQADLGLYLYAKHAEERNRENAISRQVAFNAERDRLSKRLQEAKEGKRLKDEQYYTQKLDDLDKGKVKKYPLMPDGGSGMTNQQSRDILANFETEGKTAKLEYLAKQYKERVTDKQLKYDLESGRISQEDYDNLKAKYENYVPLQVRDYVEAKNAGNTVAKLIRVKDAFQRASGAVARDFNQRVNPMSYGIVQLERSIIEGEKNKLLNTFYNLAENNPNESVWEIIEPRYKAFYKADGTVDKVDNITDQKVKDNSLYGFRDGRPFYLHIKDDLLRRAAKKEGVVKTWQVLNNVTGFLRNGLTVYNPAFWVPNFAKDNISAVFNLSAQEKDGLVAGFEKNIPGSMNGIIQYWKGNRDHTDAKVFQSYLENGAQLTYSRYDLDLEKLEHISNYFKENEKNNLNPAVWVPKLGEYMNHASELFELTTRVSAYKAAVDAGIPEHEAAVLSKEATVDFSQKGEWSPVFNSLYLFSNAGVQGATTFFKNVGKNPKVAGKVIAGAIAAGMLSAAFNQQTNGTPNPNGEDDESDYYRINDNEKQGNLMIRNVFGHGFFKIPIGHELGVFPYMGDRIYNYITGHNDAISTAADIAGYSVSAYSPVGGGSLTQTLAPTVLDPFVQLGENKNAFGTDIYKKTDANSVLPQSQSHFSTTDPIYVAIADKLHKLTGGTGAKKGLIEIPPDAIPWAIQTAVGGAGKTATQTVDLLANSVRLTPTDIKNIPVLYRFYTHGNDKNYRANVISILDASGTANVSPQDQTRFYTDAMKAVLKGMIDDKTYEQYINTFQRNQIRIKVSEQFPDATPDELKQMMSK